MVEPVEDVLLAEHGPVRRVQVLGRTAARHLPGAEPAYAAARVGQGKHEAVAESVTATRREARLVELAGGEGARQSRTAHPVGSCGRKAQAEAISRFAPDATLLEIRACGACFGRLPQISLIEACRGVQQAEKPVLLGPPPILLRRALVVLERDPIAVGQPFHGGRELQGLGLLHEADSVALRLAAEAVVHLVLRVDPEGRRALLVERTASPPLHPRALQLRTARDEVDHVDRVLDGLDAGMAYSRHCHRCPTWCLATAARPVPPTRRPRRAAGVPLRCAGPRPGSNTWCHAPLRVARQPLTLVPAARRTPGCSSGRSCPPPSRSPG